MKHVFKTIVIFLFSFSAFAQEEKNLLLQKVYGKELKNMKQQLQRLGYHSMPAEMQENLLAEIKNEEVKIKTRCFAFEGLDKNIKYATLSKNKFQEIQTQTDELKFNNLIDPTCFALSIDPLAEKFPSESPYNAMGNDPVNMVDPDGKEIRFAAGSSEEFITKTKMALELLRANDKEGVLAFLDAEGNDITITEETGASQYLDSEVNFDPDMGIVFVKEDNSLGYVSPALILYHELAHSFRDLQDPLTSDADQANKTNGVKPGMTNMEEQITLEQYEHLMAQRLGEDQRPDHSGGGNFIAESVLSNKPIASQLTEINEFMKSYQPVTAEGDYIPLGAQIIDRFGINYYYNARWKNNMKNIDNNDYTIQIPTPKITVKPVKRNDY
jgi:hypothetical protein